MTTIANDPVKCSICEKESLQGLVCSTNTFGAPDLDFRPPEMQRGTMPYWVQRCPGCGYCAADISAENTTAKDIIQTKVYKDQLKNKSYPKLANSFLCQSMILESAKALNTAAWAVMHAAWVCDDAKKKDAMRELRIRAAGLFRKALDMGQEIMEGEPEDMLVIIDALRRAGEFEEAVKECDECLQLEYHISEVGQAYKFEKQLIAIKDTTCHTFEDIRFTPVPRQGESACERLLKRATEKVWHRGEAYADEGKIQVSEMDTKVIKAVAKGTQDYNLKLVMKKTNVDTSCTCPFRGYGVCKHVVAAAIVWDEKRGIKRPGPRDLIKFCMPEPDNSGRVKLKQMDKNPLDADLNNLRQFYKLAGLWSRPHAKLPDMPTMDINPKEPLTMQEVEKALKQIVKWSTRSAYDHYFCCGEMIAAFCEVIKVIKSRLPATDAVLSIDILLYAQQFHNREFLQSIDDSEGQRSVSEAYLDDLYKAVAARQTGDMKTKLEEFGNNKGNY